MANTNAQGKIPNVAQHGFGSFRTDLFGRIKVSDAFTIFDSSHRYQESQDFDEETAGNGTVTFLPNESSLSLQVGTASGDRVTLESYKVFPYQPGKSLQVMQTFVMSPAKANLRQRAGYFSRQNGVFLELDGSIVYLVLRSYVSGSIVETRVAQNDWNVDQLNGDGPSDYVLDLNKGQIFWSEYEWLGVGSVRCGFAINGYFIPVHQFNHANVISSVYMTTASLPLRYEIENVGITESSSTLKQVCATVISNGGYLKGSDVWTAMRPAEVVEETYFPLIAIRMKSGRTDSVIVPELINIFPVSNEDFEWALIKNPDTLTGGSWITSSPRNNVEYNITCTGMSGGTHSLEGFFGAGNHSAVPVNYGEVRNFNLQLGRTNDTTPVSDVYVLAARVTTGSNNGTVKSSLSWFDLI